MSRELFINVRDLYEQIDTQHADKGPEEGMGGQMAVSTRAYFIRCHALT